MQRKSRASFASHDEWLVYLRRELSRDEQPTALAYGRMELFLRFLELRGQSLPAELKAELDLILGLPYPDRADRLDTLNDRIMAHLIEVLFAEAGPTLDLEKHTRRLTSRKQTQELLDHLASRNPYFRLWIDYKGRVGGEFNERAWNDFLLRQLDENDADSLDFAKAMGELDRLLVWSHDHNISLPRYFFERAWFLHFLREPERMAQTRALLSTLTADIPPCMSV
jgi:hypothetical protein